MEQNTRSELAATKILYEGESRLEDDKPVYIQRHPRALANVLNEWISQPQRCGTQQQCLRLPTPTTEPITRIASKNASVVHPELVAAVIAATPGKGHARTRSVHSCATAVVCSAHGGCGVGMYAAAF